MTTKEYFIEDLADSVTGGAPKAHPPIAADDPEPTTLAVGEEGDEEPTTLAIGEEGDEEPTTLATGEEGDDPVTTLAVGEEGDYE